MLKLVFFCIVKIAIVTELVSDSSCRRPKTALSWSGYITDNKRLVKDHLKLEPDTTSVTVALKINAEKHLAIIENHIFF